MYIKMLPVISLVFMFLRAAMDREKWRSIIGTVKAGTRL
jgi:hypothetical protein